MSCITSWFPAWIFSIMALIRPRLFSVMSPGSLKKFCRKYMHRGELFAKKTGIPFTLLLCIKLRVRDDKGSLNGIVKGILNCHCNKFIPTISFSLIVHGTKFSIHCISRMLDEARLREFSLTLTSRAIRQLENFETDAIESVSTKTKVFHNPEW